MSYKSLIVFCLISLLKINSGARILSVYPFPSISHQVVFRTLTLELVKRGHEVVVITPDPIYKNGESPKNLKEIDVHDISYKIWRDGFIEAGTTQGNKNGWKDQYELIFKLAMQILEEQFATDDVQKILNKEIGPFDLLIHESFYTPVLIFAHIYNIPAIQFSSFGSVIDCLNVIGAPSHPILYPLSSRQKINNIGNWEKIIETLDYIQDNRLSIRYETGYDEFLKLKFGPDTPSLSELKKRVHFLFLNVHSIWENNRPAPPNLIYLGGLHQKPARDLPEDLKTYLDSSKHGVIYISFGTNVEPAFFESHRLQAMINVFSKLPYDVLWKWNKDELSGRSENIRISKWLPQADLLKHPKIKLFITQGGLQSTDEAILAGVPLIGIPMIGDQWYNIEKYVQHGIGVQLEMDNVNEETFMNAILQVTQNDTYRQNIYQLRSVILDQPQTPLERAVWWTEYAIRHKGALHLRSPAFNISWSEYLELELLAYVILGALLFITATLFVTIKLLSFIKNFFFKSKQKLS